MLARECNKYTMDDFYSFVSTGMVTANNSLNLRYVTSRSTEESSKIIKKICTTFESTCGQCMIPIEGVFLKKTELSVKAFKYVICNTNFDCQKLLSNDPVSGHLVNLQPPFSLYLLVEIVWHLNFDDILAECILHFPLDLCVEITEILPRCIDLLDFQRALKFLTTFIQNVYKKLIGLRDLGSQTQDFNNNVKRLIANLQELILQFTNKRVFKLIDGSKEDQYKKCGILLKKIIQMVKICFSCKCKKFEVPTEMQKLYQLTFGDMPLQIIDAAVLDQYLTEINQGLIRLLLKKVKEIDCHIYLNWTEYDDEENTSLSLQRAVGLECHFFMESTKEFIDCDNKDFIHLTECLQQLASKPDPNNSVESFHLTDLCQGVSEGKKECLIALFKRYKEWDNNIIDSVDSNIFLADKEVCEQLFDHLAMELCNSHESLDLEKLQLYTLSLAHTFVYLKITDLYEIAVRFILKFGENTKVENDIDISNFENFIIHNSNLSNAKNLRVVMFFLCLKTLPTLKILLKMAIGHSDYPDVAISIEDLMILLPILKIRTKTVRETLRGKCEVKREALKIIQGVQVFKTEEKKEELPKSITLVVRVLQDICLESPKWNPNKFVELLKVIYGFCKVTEVMNEIFIPFLTMNLSSWPYLKSILIEINKIKDKCDHELNPNILRLLKKQGVEILESNHTSRYIVDELLTLIIQCIDGFNPIVLSARKDKSYAEFVSSSSEIFLSSSHINTDFYSGLHRNKCGLKYLVKSHHYLNDDDNLRYSFLKCTKIQFMLFIKRVISNGSFAFKLKMTRKADVCDKVIRLTLENCLLCLEYPEVAPPDSISFLLRYLVQLLPMITVSKEKTNLISSVCSNLITYLAILKPSIEYTTISESYNELMMKCEESRQDLPATLAALEQFASSCSQQSERLKTFTGPHTPLGIKLWLVHDILTALFNENVNMEKYILKLEEYFSSIK